MPSHHGDAVAGERDVGEDRVAARCVAIAFGLVFGLVPGRDAEEAGLRVDGPEPAVGPGPQPGDVVADGPHLVALGLERRDQHGQVGLAAGAGEGGRDVVELAAGRSSPGSACARPASPARERASRRCAARSTSCRAARCRRSRSRRSRSRAPRGSADEAAVGREVAERVQPRHEVLGAAELLERRRAHARHDPHVRDDVGAVGDLDADLAEGRAERAHHVRDHVHRAALHGAVEQREHPLAGLLRATSSCWSARRPPGAAGDEGEVLGAGDVGGVAAVEVRAGRLLGFSAWSVPSCSMPSTSRAFSASEPSHQTTRSGWSVASICRTQRSTAFMGTLGPPM